jgi:hypothetical protein
VKPTQGFIAILIGVQGPAAAGAAALPLADPAPLAGAAAAGAAEDVESPLTLAAQPASTRAAARTPPVIRAVVLMGKDNAFS